MYLVNDVADRERDAQHPVQGAAPDRLGCARRRSTALTAAGVLATAGWSWRSQLRPAFGLVAASYLVLQVLYSGPLKHIVIIDVLTIAIGFVLRVVAGAVVIGVPASHWLLDLHDSARAVPRAEQAPARTGAAGRRGERAPPHPAGIQPVSAGPDDWRGHRLDADGVHLLRHEPGDR